MWLLAALIGCSGALDSGNTTTGNGACAGEAVVEVGDGNDPFAPIEEGSDHTMTHGPQGGWHMLASVRVTNTDDIVSIHYTIDLLPEESRISDNSYRVQLKDVGNCQGTYWNMYGYLDASALVNGEADTPPELFCGKTARLTMEVEDGDGKGGQTTVEVTAVNDPADPCGMQ